MATYSIAPASNVSLATSAGTISGNFFLIQSAMGLGTLNEGMAIVQGDTFYSPSDTKIQRLAKDTNATRILANTGTNNNPKWDRLNLTNGVTGTLPIGSGGTGSNTSSHTNMAANVYGTLPTVRGGTGATASANAANGVVILDGDGEIAVASVPHLLGAWLSRNVNTSYEALTDGFVVVKGVQGTNKTMTGLTDSSDPPTTERVKSVSAGADADQGSFMMPVKKGNYWKITGEITTIYWIPMGN